MESATSIITYVLVVGGVVLIGLLVKMIVTGNYALLVDEPTRKDMVQRRSRTQAPRPPAATTTIFADLADVLLLRRKPAVAHFSEDPLELTDEEQEKVAEDLAKM
jgi:hypothetical protein